MVEKHPNELNAPPVADESSAIEILRVWGGKNLPQQCVLKTIWDDPAAWGLLLVDVARHASKAYAGTGKISEQDALARIKQGIDAEWGTPTDSPKKI